MLLAHGGTAAITSATTESRGRSTPLICVPTTAGTGSRSLRRRGVHRHREQDQGRILSNYLRPRVALVDPLLTVSCPPKVTADSGIDALTHAIEAYTAVDNADFPLPAGERSVYQGKHPMGDCAPRRRSALFGRFLRRAVKDGNDLEAREGMALAATLAGWRSPTSASRWCTRWSTRSAARPIARTAPATACCCRYVMRFNLPGPGGEFARIAELLGEDMPTPKRAITAVEQLRRRHCRFPSGFANSKNPPKPRTAPRLRREGVRITAHLRVNPRPVTVEDCEAIYRDAW